MFNRVWMSPKQNTQFLLQFSDLLADMQSLFKGCEGVFEEILEGGHILRISGKCELHVDNGL